jgi:hypothetical protein
MASPAQSSNQASGSGSKKPEAIGDLLQRLGIDDDELDDLVFEDEESAPKQGIKWMALAKVHSSVQFSPLAFEQNMRNAWSPAQRIEFNHLEGNLFTVQCSCLGDWLKVKGGGPWLFRQNIVCIEEYDGLVDPESIDLNFFDTWIQIHKLPIGYRNEALIKNLTEKKVGKVIKVEKRVHGLGNFIRVRVRLDVRKIIARVVTISRNREREYYQVQYEKIPKFCGACGFFGHGHLECGTGEHEEDKLKWGDFLKADRETWFGRSFNFGPGGGRGTGRAGWDGGRSPGRGRGQGPLTTGANRTPLGRVTGEEIDWRHNALATLNGTAADGELDDTATSPTKDMDMDKGSPSDSSAKRRLELHGKEDMDKDSSDQQGNMQPSDMNTDGSLPSDQLEPVDEKDRKKRTKKDGAISSSLGSAASLEESVRSQ